MGTMKDIPNLAFQYGENEAASGGTFKMWPLNWDTCLLVDNHQYALLTDILLNIQAQFKNEAFKH